MRGGSGGIRRPARHERIARRLLRSHPRAPGSGWGRVEAQVIIVQPQQYEYDAHLGTWGDACYQYPAWTRRIADLLRIFPGNLFLEPTASVVEQAKSRLCDRDRLLVDWGMGLSHMPSIRLSKGRVYQLEHRAFARLVVILANTLKPIDLNFAYGVGWTSAIEAAIREYEAPKKALCPHCGGRL